jgi:hypothetical protein
MVCTNGFKLLIMVQIFIPVWDWVHKSSGPVPIYHACSVFILNPDLIPKEKIPDLWNEIIKILHVIDENNEKSFNHKRWILRSSLAKHYSCHIEANLPDSDSANISTFAWWFSEKVASLFPDDAKTVDYYLNNWIEPSEKTSFQVWLVASPHIRQSFLRYLTAGVTSPWASSLFAIMGSRFEQLALVEQSPEVQTLFNQTLISHLISLIPFSVKTPPDPTFAIECSMKETATKWSFFQPEDQRKAMEQLLSTSQTLGTVEGLCKGLRKMAESPLSDQIVIGLSLKAKAYTDSKAENSVWEILSDADWRKQVLCTIDRGVLDMLIQAFSIFQADHHGKWFTEYPHFLAELCESTENDERRRSLFLYTMHASLASDTVSAVHRLLTGIQKAKFVDYVKEFREHLESLQTHYPPWVAGKVRALIASLHIV